MTFDELLAKHKAAFQEWRALVVLDDKALRRYVMCWGPALLRQHSEYPLGNSLMDLWECVSVDMVALAELVGESQSDVLSRFRQAQGMQLIYPDGTVSMAVQKVMKLRMKDVLGTKD